MAVDLSDAMIVMVGFPGQFSIFVRTHPEDNFGHIGGVEHGQVEARTNLLWFGEELVAARAAATGHVVLATFPTVTLASLIPEGCTAFRFKHNDGTGDLAAVDGDGDWVLLSGSAFAFTLDDLAQRVGIDLSTVVPLQVDSRYVEERR